MASGRWWLLSVLLVHANGSMIFQRINELFHKELVVVCDQYIGTL